MLGWEAQRRQARGCALIKAWGQHLSKVAAPTSVYDLAQTLYTATDLQVICNAILRLVHLLCSNVLQSCMLIYCCQSQVSAPDKAGQ